MTNRWFDNQPSGFEHGFRWGHLYVCYIRQGKWSIMLHVTMRDWGLGPWISVHDGLLMIGLKLGPLGLNIEARVK